MKLAAARNICIEFIYIIIQTFAKFYSLVFLNCQYTIVTALTFDNHKKELPELKTCPGTSEEHQADVKKDQENGELQHRNTMRDVSNMMSVDSLDEFSANMPKEVSTMGFQLKLRKNVGNS